MKKTLYDILEVTPDADTDLINLSCNRLMKAAADDPDANRRILIKEAHSVLSDTQRRAVYDASLARLAAPPKVIDTDLDLDAEPASRHWQVGLAIGLCIAVGIYWWQAKPAPRKTPVVVSQSVMTEVSAPVGDAPPSATTKTAEDLYSSLSSSVARIVVADANGNPLRSGSGVVVAPGAVITNCHVTKGSSQIKVKVAGKIHDASVYTTDEVFDLCRLDVTGLSASPVSVGSVSSLRTGQKVYAMGAPHGLELTISDGIVSSLRETPTGTYIQTTAPISPGSSGGGLFTASGQLVGIVTFQHRFGQNLNFAVPADWIGEMRDRSSTTATESEQPADGPKTIAATTDPGSIANRLIGSWHCFRPALGRHMDLQFQSGGALAVVANGKPYQGRYEVMGKVLTLHGSDTLSVTVDELTEIRMMLSMHSEKRMACDRQS